MTKVIDLNAQALANTARELIERLPKMKMADALAHWNLCVEQSGFAGTYCFPVVGYTRKSGIRIDLGRVAVQLERIAKGNHPLTNQTFEEAHTEALEMNEEITLVRNVELMTAEQAVIDAAREADVEKAHTEALEMNAAIDHMVDEREHVSNCEYEPFQEQARINRIGYGEVMNYPQHFGNQFVWLRRTALNLYASGYVTEAPELAGYEYREACKECRAQWVAFA